MNCDLANIKYIVMELHKEGSVDITYSDASLTHLGSIEVTKNDEHTFDGFVTLGVCLNASSLPKD